MALARRSLAAGFALAWMIIGTAQHAVAQTVVRGPYLQLGTADGIVLRWRTDVPAGSAVHYGLAPNTLDSTVSDATTTTNHEVALVGLLADTRYYYDIGTPTDVLAGGGTGHFFVTAPADGTAKATRLWVIGDAGTANANAAAVRDAYKAYAGAADTDFMLMLDDNAYPDGTDDQYQAAVFDMYPELLRQSVAWPTLGNHDGHTADSATQSGAYYEIFTLPTGGEAGGLASGTEAYYAFDYGNIHFISLESYETDRSTSGAMMTWLEADLAATDKDWIIAFWHHPPYTKGNHDSDTESRLIEMRQNALPILDSYGVDLVLSGHSHSYERSFLIDGHYGTSDTLDGSMILDGGDGRDGGDGAYSKTDGAAYEGAVYAVAGSSGKVSGGGLDHPAMFISLNSLGSMVLDVAGNRLDAVFLDAGGTVQDSFTMVKGADTFPPTIVSVAANDANTVTVQFSEQLDAGTAEIAGNYAIDQSVGVSQAALAADGRSVVLTTTAMAAGTTYWLTAAAVADAAGNPVAPGTEQSFTYVTLVTASFQDGVAPDAG